MTNKICLAVLMGLVLGVNGFADMSAGTPNVAQKFETALRWENAGLFVPAVRTYKEVLALIPPTPDVEEVSFYRRYTALATYRLAMVSVQTAYTGIAKLTDQVSTLQSVTDQVDMALALLIVLPEVSPVEKLWMGLLYDARARLGVAMSYHLLNAIVWKHYIIYPLYEISGIVTLASQDYGRSLSDLDPKPEVSTSTWKRLLTWFHLRDMDVPPIYRTVDKQMNRVVHASSPEDVALTFRALKASDLHKAKQNVARLYLRAYQTRQLIRNSRIAKQLRDADESDLAAVIGNRRLFRMVDRLAESAGLLYGLP